MLFLLWLFSITNGEPKIISRHCNGNAKEMIVALSDDRTVNKFLFFEDGTIEEVFQEQDENRHGTCTRFWSNGNVMSQSTWEQGSLIKGVMYSPSGALIGEIPDINMYTQVTVSLKTSISPIGCAESECEVKYSAYATYSAYIGPDGALDFLFIGSYPHIKDLDLAIYNTLAGVDFLADVVLNSTEGIFFSRLISFHLQ